MKGTRGREDVTRAYEGVRRGDAQVSGFTDSESLDISPLAIDAQACAGSPLGYYFTSSL